MRCPLCGTETSRAGRAPAVEVCQSCLAIWFDAGELRQLRPTGPLLFTRAKRGLGHARKCPRCDDHTLEPFVRDRAPFFACGQCEGMLLLGRALTLLERGPVDRSEQEDVSALETAANVAALGVSALTGDLAALAALGGRVLLDQLQQLDDEDPIKRLERLTR